MKNIKGLFTAVGTIGLVLGIMAFQPGCATKTVTSQVVSTNSSGVVSTNSVTNTTVNQTVLGIDELMLQGTATGAVIIAYQKDKASLPVMQNLSTALTGIINGSNPNSVSQIMAAAGQTNAALGQAMAPLITTVSGLEQGLIAKGLNSTNTAVASRMAVAQGLATAVNTGITIGLATLPKQ